MRRSTEYIDGFVRLGGAIINQAIEDLKDDDPHARLATARYLFCDDGDDHYFPTSFNGIRKLTGTDPDILSRKIWDNLPQGTRERIKQELKDFVQVTSRPIPISVLN